MGQSVIAQMKIDLFILTSFFEEELNMPWCPVCKNEYVDGIKMCADCKVELVDELERKEKPITFGTEEEMQKLNDFLQYNQVLSGKIKYDEKEQIHEIFVSPEDSKQAKKLASIFMQEEILKNQQESEESEEQDTKDITELPVYENKSDKAENFKTSAYTLILVGSIGVVVLVLSALKVITFQFGILAYIVMGILFSIFLVMGILSFGSYKKISKEAVSENNLTKEIKAWCIENLTADKIDQGLFTDEIAEEMKYFKRAEQMKKLISETYINLEDGFLDAIVEELYPTIFE